jgi:hypothetical protein
MSFCFMMFNQLLFFLTKAESSWLLLAVHLISLTNSSKTSDRGALSRAKKNYETHHPPYGTFLQREATRMTLTKEKNLVYNLNEFIS